MPPRMKNISAGSNVAERITILLVSPDKNDGDALLRALPSDEWLIDQCHNVSDALGRLPEAPDSIVVCERDLLDGDWRNLLERLHRIPDPPPLLVVSRHADERLWAEVLNLGGYDVLLKPFDKGEVSRIFRLASRRTFAMAHGSAGVP